MLPHHSVVCVADAMTNTNNDATFQPSVTTKKSPIVVDTVNKKCSNGHEKHLEEVIHNLLK